MTSTILAHAGGIGWDELLLILPVPILFFVFLILGARSRRPPDAEDGPDDADDSPDDADDSPPGDHERSPGGSA